MHQFTFTVFKIIKTLIDNFDSRLEFNQSQYWCMHRYNLSQSSVDQMASLSITDTAYMMNSIKKLQTHNDVRAIVCVTHTVPTPELTKYDLDLVDTWRYNTLGNKHMQLALNEDTENKIHTWCFGHYHKAIDQNLNGIRYLCNPHGRGNTPWSQSVYYPKRIEINY